MYVIKRVELAEQGLALQKMYLLLFYYYQLQSPFRHLTLEDIHLFIMKRRLHGLNCKNIGLV